MAPDIIFYRTKMGKKYKQDCDFVHGVAEDIINKRRRTLVFIKNNSIPTKVYDDPISFISNVFFLKLICNVLSKACGQE
jgi:hypothetical protein